MAVNQVRRGHALPPLERGQVALIGALLGFAALSWVVTALRMRGMDAGPGTDLGALGLYTTNWVVMMAAMMFPSILPMVLGYSRVERGMRSRGRAGSPAAFVSGYLVVWTLFGLIAYGVFNAVKTLSIGPFAWSQDGRYLAGGVIVAAALYQLTPVKDACLRWCRDPFGFLAEEWRDGRAGALTMGTLHGAWCVGCCWALMAALFALGVMSVGWMVFMAAIVALEKLVPQRRIATQAVAATLSVLGLAVALIPTHVPGLTLPNAGHRAMPGMQSSMPGMAKPSTGK